MSLSDVIVKLIGLVLAVVGLALLLALVGVNFIGVNPTTFSPIVEVILGVCFLGAGIYIIRGGNVSI